MNWKTVSLTASLIAVLATPAALSQAEADVAAPAAVAPSAPMVSSSSSPAQPSARSQTGGNWSAREHRGGRRYWNHRHDDGTIHRHYPRHRRNPRFYTYYDPFYSPFGYGYGYGYPYYGASAALYYNGYRPQQYRRSGGSVVVGVQRGLAAAGYYRGAVDGVFGPQTGAAIRAFERDNGLRVDGQIDNRLLGTLGVR